MKKDRRRYLKSKKPTAPNVQGLLESNEKILWQGQPIPRYTFWSGLRGDALLTKILFLFAGLVVVLPFSAPGGYWTYTTIQAFLDGNATTSIAVGVIQVVLGLVLVSVPYYWVLRSQINACRIAKYVYYIITNRRTMMLYLKKGHILDKRIKPLNAIFPPKLVTLGLKGVGNVIYDSEGEFCSTGDSGSPYFRSFDVGFDGVANAKEVMGILQEAIANNRKGGANKANAANARTSRG